MLRVMMVEVMDVKKVYEHLDYYSCHNDRTIASPS